MKGCLGKILVALLLGGFLLVIGGYFWTKSYLRSDEFMSLVQYGVSKKLGGHVEVAETEWDGWTLKNDHVEVLAGKGFQDLEMERISVELDPRGFMDRVWRVADVHVREVSLHLGDPLKEVEKKEIGEFPVEFTWKDIGKAWLPRKAEVDFIRVEKCQGSFLSQGVGGYWENVELQLERESVDYLVNVPRGAAYLSDYPEVDWQIQTLRGRLKSDSFFITEAQLKGAEQALLTFTGEGAFNGDRVFQGELQDFPIDKVLREDWKKRLVGELQGNFTARSTPADVTAEGKIHLENGAVTALPALDAIAKQTGVTRFRHITLDTCESDYKVKEKTAYLDNLLLISGDFLKVTGKMQTDGANGSGTLQLGIHFSLMEKMPRGSETVFAREEEGHFWTEVNLTQEEGEWKNDLTSRLMGAVMKAMFLGAPEAATDVIDSVQKAISGSAESGDPERVIPEEVIKKGSDLIETGVKSLFDLLGN